MDTLTISTLMKNSIVDSEGKNLSIVDLICKKLTMIEKEGRYVDKIGNAIECGKTSKPERDFVLEQFSRHPQTMKLFPACFMFSNIQKYGNNEQKSRINKYVHDNFVQLANHRWANWYVNYYIKTFPSALINKNIINNFNELVQNEIGKYTVKYFFYDALPSIWRQQEVCGYIEKLVGIFNDHVESSLNENMGHAFQEFLYFINEANWSQESAMKYALLQPSVQLYRELVENGNTPEERKLHLEKNFAVQLYCKLQPTFFRKQELDNFLEELKEKKLSLAE